MDIKVHKHKKNPEYKEQISFFRKVTMIRDNLACRGLTYCIIPMESFFLKKTNKERDLPVKIKDFYYAIIAEGIMERLENLGIINWWYKSFNRLYVSYTNDSIDDSLYCSASIGMWGFEDSKSVLEYCKSELKNNLNPSGLKSLWKFEMLHERRRVGFADMVGKCPTRNDGYERHLLEIDAPEDRIMLPDLNTYILSNALRRPILIFASGYSFKRSYMNVYLPLNHHPDECCKYPLILTWYDGVYYPILQMEGISEHLEDLVPLVNKQGDLAQVYFIRDPNKCYDNFPSSEYLRLKLSALEKYMDVVLREGATTTAGEKPLKYHCARIPLTLSTYTDMISEDRPFYYTAFRDYKMREMGIPRIQTYEMQFLSEILDPKNQIK